MKLWEELAESNVLLAPGYIFDAKSFEVPQDAEEEEGTFRMGRREELRFDDNGDGYFRLSFSTASVEDMTKASIIFARTLKVFFSTEQE